MPKTVIEFGIRGGASTDNIVLPNIKTAQQMAANLVFVFSRDATFSRLAEWKLRADKPRISWQSSTHYVSISILDGVMRGPASATLWKKD